MNKTAELKDYLHLYLGCDLLEIKTGDVITFDEIKTTERWPVWTRNIKYCEKGGEVAHGFKFREIKPILRPLSDMTESEKTELYHIDDHALFEIGGDGAIGYALPTVFHWLLSKHFDLFGLIEAGLAVDKCLIFKP